MDERGYNRKILYNFSFFKPREILVSFNKHKHTLRGFHFRKDLREKKIITCLQGEIFDVIVNLNKSSKNFLKSYIYKISAQSNESVYCPAGYAHGYLTLCDNCEVHYSISSSYDESQDSGIIWNDATLNINWPFKPSVISNKDLNLKKLNEVL